MDVHFFGEQNQSHAVTEIGTVACVTIPDSVTEIWTSAFFGCSSEKGLSFREVLLLLHFFVRHYYPLQSMQTVFAKKDWKAIPQTVKVESEQIKLNRILKPPCDPNGRDFLPLGAQ